MISRLLKNLKQTQYVINLFQDLHKIDEFRDPETRVTDRGFFSNLEF